MLLFITINVFFYIRLSILRDQQGPIMSEEIKKTEHCINIKNVIPPSIIHFIKKKPAAILTLIEFIS